MTENRYPMYELVPHGGAGLACDDDGVSLGPVPMIYLTRGETGKRSYRVRPSAEMAEVLRAAYGPIGEAAVDACYACLARVADLLEKGERVRAPMQALLLGFPEILPDGMARLADAMALHKCNPNWPNEPRGPAPGYTQGEWLPSGTAPRVPISYGSHGRRSHSGARLVEPDELPADYKNNLTNRDWVNPTGMPIRGRDAEGDGAFGTARADGTLHGGADWQSVPGQIVNAPTNGTYIGPVNHRGLSGVRIDIGHGTTVDLLYVSPTVRPGSKLLAGDPIGDAQNIRPVYGRTITNHAHVQIKIPGIGVVVDPTPLIPH